MPGEELITPNIISDSDRYSNFGAEREDEYARRANGPRANRRGGRGPNQARRGPDRGDSQDTEQERRDRERQQQEEERRRDPEVVRREAIRQTEQIWDRVPGTRNQLLNELQDMQDWASDMEMPDGLYNFETHAIRAPRDVGVEPNSATPARIAAAEAHRREFAERYFTNARLAPPGRAPAESASEEDRIWAALGSTLESAAHRNVLQTFAHNFERRSRSTDPRDRFYGERERAWAQSWREYLRDPAVRQELGLELSPRQVAAEESRSQPQVARAEQNVGNIAQEQIIEAGVRPGAPEFDQIYARLNSSERRELLTRVRTGVDVRLGDPQVSAAEQEWAQQWEAYIPQAERLLAREDYQQRLTTFRLAAAQRHPHEPRPRFDFREVVREELRTIQGDVSPTEDARRVEQNWQLFAETCLVAGRLEPSQLRALRETVSDRDYQGILRAMHNRIRQLHQSRGLRTPEDRQWALEWNALRAANPENYGGVVEQARIRFENRWLNWRRDAETGSVRSWGDLAREALTQGTRRAWTAAMEQRERQRPERERMIADVREATGRGHRAVLAGLDRVDEATAPTQQELEDRFGQRVGGFLFRTFGRTAARPAARVLSPRTGTGAGAESPDDREAGWSVDPSDSGFGAYRPYSRPGSRLGSGPYSASAPEVDLDEVPPYSGPVSTSGGSGPRFGQAVPPWEAAPNGPLPFADLESVAPDDFAPGGERLAVPEEGETITPQDEAVAVEAVGMIAGQGLAVRSETVNLSFGDGTNPGYSALDYFRRSPELQPLGVDEEARWLAAHYVYNLGLYPGGTGLETVYRLTEQARDGDEEALDRLRWTMRNIRTPGGVATYNFLSREAATGVYYLLQDRMSERYVAPSASQAPARSDWSRFSRPSGEPGASLTDEDLEEPGTPSSVLGEDLPEVAAAESAFEQEVVEKVEAGMENQDPQALIRLELEGNAVENIVNRLGPRDMEEKAQSLAAHRIYNNDLYRNLPNKLSFDQVYRLAEAASGGDEEAMTALENELNRATQGSFEVLYTYQVAGIYDNI